MATPRPRARTRAVPRRSSRGLTHYFSGKLQLWSIARQAVSSWIANYAPSMGAAIAYYTIFSIAPLLLIVIAVAGLVFGESVVREQLVLQLRDLLGNSGAQAIRQLLIGAADPNRRGLTALVGAGALLIGASSVFAELQSALNRIWRTAPVASRGIGLWPLIRARLLSFGMILCIGFLLAVSLTLSTALHAVANWWTPMFAGWTLALEIVNATFSFGIVTLLFAFIYRVLPNATIGWSDVWFGALVTALLFEVGKDLISLYLGASSINTTFGAAGSFAVLLLWVYYSAQVFLLGASFTWVYSHQAGTLRAR